MKTFCFTVDDNIRFLKEITENRPESLFAHPYVAMLARLHQRFGVKIQLNLFYRMEGFDLSQMSDVYAREWQSVSDWLKLSFHSELENVRPYENAGYETVFADCDAVQKQILRFASPASLAKNTTVHYCRTTPQGVRALKDCGVRGLLGLFGSEEAPTSSYGLDEQTAAVVRGGASVCREDVTFASIDMIVNKIRLEELLPKVTELLDRDSLRVMIHEQYFYGDYHWYQPDFEEKLNTVFSLLCQKGYQSCFFEELIPPEKEKT